MLDVHKRSGAVWRRYLQYLIVGGIVGVVTIALREAVAFLIGTDTPLTYALSIVIAYATGIMLSFVWQSGFTFGRRVPYTAGRMALFAIVATAGAGMTVVLARFIRYGLEVDHQFGLAGPGLAFAFAALSTSVVSYAVNEHVVFASISHAAVERRK